MNLEELVNKHYEHLNNNDLHVLKYILNNKSTCYQMGINELSEACYVSRSSLHRMTKKLGFSGYSEFRVTLKWEKEPVQNKNNHIDVLKSDIETTLKNLSPIDFGHLSEMLHASERIFIYGTGTAQLTCAVEAQRMFAVVGRFVTIVHDQIEFESIFSVITENDIVIILSLSGDTPALIPQVKQLSAKGITFISITNLKDNKIAQIAPYNIYATITNELTVDGNELASFIPFHITFETIVRNYIEYIGK